MKEIFFSLVITIALATLTSCNSAKQSTIPLITIVGKYWKLVKLNDAGVQALQATQQMKREPHMILNVFEKSVNGSGGCNSFFGTYELQSDNGITFSKIGSTKMACPDDIMKVERQLFQAFEMANRYSVRNDTLFLMKTDMSTLASLS